MIKELSLEQRAAVESRAKNTLVIAGAGSGKTETLAQRVRYLLTRFRDERSSADRFVVITFTNEAAGELRRRLAGYGVEGIGYIGTLHGYCLRLLQKHGSLIGYGPRIVVLTEDQSDELLRSAADMLKHKGPWKRVTEVRDRWHEDSEIAGDTSLQAIVVGTYHRLMRESNSVDYDTILHAGLRLIRMLAAQGTLDIRALLVDEFQDSARVDLMIYRALPAVFRFYVGDPDQAIYGFRGGDIRNILDTAGDPSFTVVRLQANYRSAQSICKAAQSLIGRNTQRVDKATISARDDQGEINAAMEFGTGEQEAIGIMLAVRLELSSTHVVIPDGARASISDGGDITADKIAMRSVAPSQIAVLARTNAQVDDLINAGDALALPINRRKPMPPDWRLACLTLDMLINPRNDLVFAMWLTARALNSGRDEKSTRAHVQSTRDSASFVSKPICELFQPSIPAVARDTLWLALRDKFGVSDDSLAIMQAAARDLESDWTMPELSIAVRKTDDPKLTRSDGITITTFHGAKGREWETVFIAGAEQNLVPSKRKDVDIEAERRLFYVAITRSKSKLYISHALQRKPPHSFKYEPSEPSQFIAELIGG